MDQITELPYLKHLAYHDGHSGHDVELEYAIFDDGGPHIPGPICVFSTSPQYGQSLVLCAREVISRIRRKEGFGWHDVRFCDMQTHNGSGHGASRGYYCFKALFLKDDERQPGGTPYVDSWRSIECPLPVFRRFEELIGPFLTLEEELDHCRPCYQEYTEEQMRREREAWEKHLQWWDERIAENFECNKHKLVSIEEAFARNYRLMPWDVHLGLIPDENLTSSEVLVDLQGSHLFGQCAHGKGFDVSERPKRYSLWKSELEWYPIKREQLQTA